MGGGVPKMVGFPNNGGIQQLLVVLVKMIILGCFGDTTILGNPHIMYHVYLLYICMYVFAYQSLYRRFVCVCVTV